MASSLDTLGTLDTLDTPAMTAEGGGGWVGWGGGRRGGEWAEPNAMVETAGRVQSAKRAEACINFICTTRLTYCACGAEKQVKAMRSG